MLEGKELVGTIRDMGSYEVDLKDDGTAVGGVAIEKSLGGILKIKGALTLEVDAIEGLRKLAKKANKPFLIVSVEALAKSLGR